jgi:hypothetical protein
MPSLQALSASAQMLNAAVSILANQKTSLENEGLRDSLDLESMAALHGEVLRIHTQIVQHLEELDFNHAAELLGPLLVHSKALFDKAWDGYDILNPLQCASPKNENSLLSTIGGSGGSGGSPLLLSAFIFVLGCFVLFSSRQASRKTRMD